MPSSSSSSKSKPTTSTSSTVQQPIPPPPTEILVDAPIELVADSSIDPNQPVHNYYKYNQLRSRPYGVSNPTSNQFNSAGEEKKSDNGENNDAETVQLGINAFKNMNIRDSNNRTPSLNDQKPYAVEGFGHILDCRELEDIPDVFTSSSTSSSTSTSSSSTKQNKNKITTNTTNNSNNSNNMKIPNRLPNASNDLSYEQLTAPIKSLQDKWRLLPQFLSLRGLMRQHIDSYNTFVTTTIKQIVRSPSACEIRSDNDPNFFLRYTDCWVGEPSVEDDSYVSTASTPFNCRLRDCTYSAPIYVNLVYVRGKQKVKKTNVVIGRMPVMLRSCKCVLEGKGERELGKLKECPYDPGGYFVIKGVEKVILMQEQLSKNRVIIEEDNKKQLGASITSSTNERKSRCNIFMKGGRIYMKNNIMGEDIPIVLVLRAMGLTSDAEVIQLIGGEKMMQDSMALCLEEVGRMGVRTQEQALRYIGTKIRSPDKRGATATMSNVTQPTVVPVVNGKASAAEKKAAAVAADSNTTWFRRPTLPEDEAREVLATVVLSHVPVLNFDFRPKCIYICHIIRRIILVSIGQAELDDKDYYGNKRLELAGQLLSLLFEDLFKHFNKNLKKEADIILSKPNRVAAFDVTKCIRQDTISSGMVNAISTGNWVLKRFRMDRAGVTQVLSRLSYISALGMMTRVNSQFEKTRKVSGPRSLQPSQWGMLCPCDTPEGEACGLVKNLALLAHVTTDEATAPISRLCFDFGVYEISALSGGEINHSLSYLVLLNGLVLGAHCNPKKLVKQLRFMRRQGMVGEFVSVYLHVGQRAVHIASDGGRVCRPLIVVSESTQLPLLTQMHLESVAMGIADIKDLMRAGVIEYVDVNEENNCLIAVMQADLRNTQNERYGKHTHLEVDPLTLIGVVAGLIPFPHHNQSPRNTYQSAMGKQAMGTIAMNQYERIDGLLYTLVYPMKPMVKTRTLDLVHFDDCPAGQNACIAVMSYSGYDIEDATVLNKASIDRGFGRCMVIKKQQCNLKKYANGTRDMVEGPPGEHLFTNGSKDKRFLKYAALDESDGICCVGALVSPGQILINKTSPKDITNAVDANGQMIIPGDFAMTQKSTPMFYKNSAPSYVDKVVLTSNENDSHLVKLVLRQTRRPEIGDKFSSRHGQKGVCGIIVSQADMPFSDLGVCPDLIMNPHGFPSRMTVGKLLELVVGKAGVFTGRQAYGSAFGEELGNADTAEAAAKALIANGYNYSGKDTLYSGQTGMPLDAYVFAGPVFYQKLKHMVLDKMHARAKGPRAVLTRQPTEGRSRDGGLRLGEMERDCLIAYGASNLIMERLMTASDAFTANVCQKCGLLQYKGWCQYCRTGEKVTDIRLPYACKLLFQELQSMNVLPRLRLKDV